MSRIIAVANQKGGVGKTTTAVNLTAAIAATGKSTLLVDLDPQGNASQGVGVNKNACEHTVYNALVDSTPLDAVIITTRYDCLAIAPSHRDLSGAAIELVEEDQREYRMRQALETVRERFEVIVIDCPPSLGLLTLNGLVAADEVLIPLQCEYYALEGLSELLHTVIQVREHFNNRLHVSGVLLTMYQHTNLSKQVVEDVRNHLGDKVFQTVIPRNVSLSEAPGFGLPIFNYDKRCVGAKSYAALAQEVLSGDRN